MTNTHSQVHTQTPIIIPIVSSHPCYQDVHPDLQSHRLTLQEEQVIVDFYALCIDRLVSKLMKEGYGRLEKIRVVAITFLMRFYLRHSLMDIKEHPKLISAAAIFLACKVEEVRNIPLTKITTAMKGVKEEEVVRAELTLLNGLHFHVKVFTPHICLYGFTVDLKEMIGKAAQIYFAKAGKFLDTAVRSDLIFLNPPGLIALGALAKAMEGSSHSTMLESFLRGKVKDEAVFNQLNTLRTSSYWERVFSKVHLQKAKAADLKLTSWKNLAMNKENVGAAAMEVER